MAALPRYSASSAAAHQPQYDQNHNYYQNQHAPAMYYNNVASWHCDSSIPPPYETETVEMYPASHSRGHNNHNSGNYQVNGTTTTVRPRYPQLPPPSYANTPPSFYSNNNMGGSYSQFNSSGGSGKNCGRSNCFSPTYMGLTEVMASRAPGSTVLYLDPKRSRNFWTNFKLKHILLILISFLLISLFSILLFNAYMKSGVKPIESKKKATAEPTTTKINKKETTKDSTSTNNVNTNTTPTPKPKKLPVTSTSGAATAGPTERETRSTKAEKPKTDGKYSNIIYSVDDFEDGEVFIEDVIL